MQTLRSIRGNVGSCISAGKNENVFISEDFNHAKIPFLNFTKILPIVTGLLFLLSKRVHSGIISQWKTLSIGTRERILAHTSRLNEDNIYFTT